jgi:hypothetical protein
LDDRFARPPGAAHRCNIGSDLLDPYMCRSTGQAAAAAPRLLAVVGGVAVRWWPSLDTLVGELCAAPRLPGLGDEIESPAFDVSDQPAWWEPYEDAVNAMLDAIDEPTRLSQLLARVEDTAPTVTDQAGEPLDANLLAAATVHAAHRAWTTRLAGRTVGERLVVGVAVGATLDTGDIHSSDLLLVPATVIADIDEPGSGRKGARDTRRLLVDSFDDALDDPNYLKSRLAG